MHAHDVPPPPLLEKMCRDVMMGLFGDRRIFGEQLLREVEYRTGSLRAW